MNERQTKTITTPGGHEVVVYAYLTGREAQDLKAIMFSAVKVDIDDAQSGALSMKDVPSSFLLEQERKALQILLVSVDGTAENAAERLLDLPSSEYDSVIEEINKIQNPTKPQK